MIKMSIALKRRTDLDRADFLDHWRNIHGPLIRTVAEPLGIQRYVQLHVMESAPVPENHDYDGVAEVWFRSLDDMAARRADPLGRDALQRVRNDELKFIDRTQSLVWLGEEHVIIAQR